MESRTNYHHKTFAVRLEMAYSGGATELVVLPDFDAMLIHIMSCSCTEADLND